MWGVRLRLNGHPSRGGEAAGDNGRGTFARLVVVRTHWGLAVLLATLPTAGFSLLLAPLPLLLSAVAWRRSPHDPVLWLGLALSGLMVLGLVGALAGVLIGESSVG